MFEETPKVDFSVTDEQGNVVYRDSIVYETMADLRADNIAEREAKFQARYDNWGAMQNQPPQDQEEQITPEEA